MFWLVILVVLFSGCGQVSQTAEIGRDAVETIVAATLTAVPLITSDIEGVSPTETLEVVSQNPTSTPGLTLTDTPSIPPSATPTDTPTHTPTSVPTEGNPHTPAPDDPVDSLGSPDWRASFQDSSYWYTFEDQQASIQVKNGALILESFRANSYESWSMSYPKISDFYLEIQGVSGDVCKGKDRYGIIFRAPDPNKGYLFGISCDGYYRVRTWDGEKFTELVGWQRSEHISIGSSQTNRIGVLADGTDLSFYINGHLVEEVQNDTYHSGVFGAYIAAAETKGFTVSVNQASYWEMD
jgi:hypothetical protein